MQDSYQDSRFSYQSDVTWLAEQGRPFYYGIIIILLYFEFYLLAIFYACSALTLIWEIDEGDAINEELESMESGYSDAKYNRDSDIINFVIMTDYLENVVVDIWLNDYPSYIIEYYQFLDSKVPALFKDHDFLTPEFSFVEPLKGFEKKEISKIGDELNKFMLIRERNKETLNTKLLKFKERNIQGATPKKRAVVRARMRKVMAMAKQLEEDLLLYKISVESHNTVLLALNLQMGLYPVTLYDVDLLVYFDFESVIYSNYLVGGFVSSSYFTMEDYSEGFFNYDFSLNL